MTSLNNEMVVLLGHLWPGERRDTSDHVDADLHSLVPGSAHGSQGTHATH
jgi:hypothetical protein